MHNPMYNHGKLIINGSEVTYVSDKGDVATNTLEGALDTWHLFGNYYSVTLTEQELKWIEQKFIEQKFKAQQQ